MSHTFSATQIKTYEMCPRKWAWQHIDGIRPDQSRFAEFGVNTHAYLERWLKEKVVPQGGADARAAQALIPLLPPPQSVDPADVEREIRFTLIDVPFVGVVDLWMPNGGANPPQVIDHKTTSDFDWALRPEAMVDDVQATLYAYWALLQVPTALAVELRWNYVLSRGSPRTLPVVQQVTGKMIQDRISRTAASAREARLIKESGARAIDVPYDASACEAFGGCPYREKCNLSPQERVESIMSQGTAKEDYMEKLRARKNGAAMTPDPSASAVAVSPPLAPPAVSAPLEAAANSGNRLAERLRARAAGAAGAAPVVASVVPVAIPVAIPVAAPVAAAPVVVAPVAAQVAAPVEPARRGPGRPRKEVSEQNPDAEVWDSFAQSALTSLLAKVDFQEVADEDSCDGVTTLVVEVAIEVADRMLRERKMRFS